MIESKKAVEARDALQEEVSTIRARLEEVESEALAAKEETATLREVRDEVVKDRGDVQRRLDVLTEFFNKKEAELQKQLGLQSAMFGDVSTDAESTARKLISVTSEVESEMSVFRNRLTVAESKNTLLEQEKADLSEA